MKISKWKKWLIMLSVVLTVWVLGTVQAEAKEKKTVFPTEYVTLEVGSKEKLVLKNPEKVVKWSTSNKKIAKIVKKTGKNKGNAVIASENKTGSCVIKAVVGNKVYKYHITVIDKSISGGYSGNNSKITLVKAKNTGTSFTVRFQVCNASNKMKYYNEFFELKKYVNGKWKAVPMVREHIYFLIGYPFPEKTRYVTTYNLTEYYDLSKITKGRYRLYVDYDVVKKSKRYVEFKL